MDKRKKYKCDSCGGHMYFDTKTQTVVCEYCGSREAVATPKKIAPAKVRYTDALKYHTSKDALTLYECTSCMAKISAVADKEVTRCPSCGNTSVVQAQGYELHPMHIVPFQVSKAEASSLFERWLSSKRFAPSDLKSMARLQKVSGLYVPVYSFDMIAKTDYSCIGIDESRDSDGTIDEDSYHINDTQSTEYVGHIYSANKKMTSGVSKTKYHLRSDKIAPFSTDYLIGFTGLNTDEDVHTAYRKVVLDISHTEQSRIRSRLRMKYDDIEFFKANTYMENVECAYVYVPLWVNHYMYKGKDYHCYINGQTGEVAGATPTSFIKSLLFIGGIVAFLCTILGIALAMV